MSIAISLFFFIAGTWQGFRNPNIYVSVICLGFSVVWYILYLIERRMLQDEKLKKDYIFKYLTSSKKGVTDEQNT